MKYTISQNQVALLLEINIFEERNLCKGICGLCGYIVSTPIDTVVVLSDRLIAIVFEIPDTDKGEFIITVKQIAQIYKDEEFNRIFGKKENEFLETDAYKLKTATDEDYYKFIKFEENKHLLRECIILDGSVTNSIEYNRGQFIKETI